MKNVFEPVTKSIKDVPEDVTRTMMETSIENNKALTNINDKLLEIMNDGGIIPSYLLSPLSKVTTPEHTSQFKLVKDPNSNRVNDLLINKTIPVTLYEILLTFRDTDKNFKLEGDFSKLITNKNYNVDPAYSQDRKIWYEFAKEMYFAEKPLGNESTRDKSLIRLLKQPGILISVSGVSSAHKEKSFSKTKFLWSNPHELCDRLKLLLQEKRAGIGSNIINEEIIAMADKLLEYKCISTKQPKFFLLECFNSNV